MKAMRFQPFPPELIAILTGHFLNLETIFWSSKLPAGSEQVGRKPAIAKPFISRFLILENSLKSMPPSAFTIKTGRSTSVILRMGSFMDHAVPLLSFLIRTRGGASLARAVLMPSVAIFLTVSAYLRSLPNLVRQASSLALFPFVSSNISALEKCPLAHIFKAQMDSPPRI